jgi:predicted transcriptional regulator
MKGGKTRFEQKFTEEMFLNALSFDSLKSTAAVLKTVGCSRSTAKNMLDKLLIAGKIKKVEIEGNGYGWQKTVEDK